MTKEQRKKLKELFFTKTNAEISMIIGVRTADIRNYSKHMKWKKPENLLQSVRITNEQKEIIINEYPYCGNEELSKRLGIKVRTILNFASKLGLKKTKECLKCIKSNQGKKLREINISNGIGVPEEIEKIVIDMYPDAVDNDELCKEIGISMHQLMWIRRKYKIHKTHECRSSISARRRINVKSQSNSEIYIKESKKSKIHEEQEKNKRNNEMNEIRKKTVPTTDNYVKAAANVGRFEKPKSNEPCINEKCKCFKKCRTFPSFNGTICDAYMFLHFMNDSHKMSYVENM